MSDDKPLKCICHFCIKFNVVFSHPLIGQEGRKEGRKERREGGRKEGRKRERKEGKKGGKAQ